MKKKELEQEQPIFFEGGMLKDERGSVSFVNRFNFRGIKRFYIVKNIRKGMVRAWHGHKHEAKYVFVVSGAAKVGVVRIDDWKHPSKRIKVHAFLLSAEKPEILYIPKGHANGFKSLTADAKLIFFSTRTLEQSKNDDIRFEPKYWDIWG